MFQRQIIQAYTPVLAFSTFPPSFTDILDAPEMRRARRTLSPGSSQAREDLPRAAPITPSPSVGDSGDRGADTDDESEGEWSDEDDSDDSDDNAPDSMPMLGNYRVTRPESSGDDAEVLMLGDHQVTRAPTPAEGDSEEPKVAHGQAPAGSESVMLAREEEAADDKSSVKVGEEGGAAGEVGAEDKEKDAEEDEKLDEEEDEEEVGSENEPKPSSPCSSPRKAPQAVRPTSDGSNPDFPPGQLPRRPSNFFPNEANAPITYNEKMSALMAEELSKIATLKLSESMWAPKPDEKSQVMSQKASSSSSSTPPAEHKTPPRMSNVGTSQADQAPPHGQEQLPRRPSNLFPDEANAPITHNEKMSVLIADGLSKVATIPLSASIWATKPEEKSQVMPQAAPSSSSAPPADHRTSARMLSVGSSQADQAPPRGPSISNDGPKPQPPPDAPTGPRGHLARDSVQGGLQQNQGANSQTSPLGRQPNVAPPQGAANRNDNWSPRGNARRGYQPGQPRRNWAPEPPRTPPAAAGNDTNTNTQYPPAGRRGGRGGRGTPPPASGPPRTPAPNTPRAAPAAIFGDNTPPAGPAGRRGGRGGRGQAAPQAGPARGGRSAAMESFARQNLGKKEG